jgi:hypothetical protein
VSLDGSTDASVIIRGCLRPEAAIKSFKSENCTVKFLSILLMMLIHTAESWKAKLEANLADRSRHDREHAPMLDGKTAPHNTLPAMTKEIWLAILSSSLLSGIIGAFIAGLFNLRGKHNEYVNEYYQTVLKRRLAAYESVENLVILLKVAVMDGDSQPYHLMFSKEDTFEAAYKAIFGSMSQGLWLSPKLYEAIRDLNYLVFEQGNAAGTIDFGKKNYKAIAELRSGIERLHATDILKMHNVQAFLREKQKYHAGEKLIRVPG